MITEQKKDAQVILEIEAVDEVMSVHQDQDDLISRHGLVIPVRQDQEEADDNKPLC